MKWYIVNTLSGGEKRAYDALTQSIKNSPLKDQFGEVLVPTETTVDPHATSGRTKTRKRKFFPGYMLVQLELNEATYHLVNETSQIVGFVGRPPLRGGAVQTSEEMLASIPAMSDKEVEEIKRKMNINVEKADVCDTLDLKCTVRVLDGPFVNFTGSVESIDKEKRRVSVNVSILGRVVPVDLDFSQVERVNA